ncbi:MAG TPA: hypothetical protein VFV38_26915 [Ktedonobacteraceae bacterium]|nr:hypothetical protein [Ktedonobacteraceae bacterium]
MIPDIDLLDATLASQQAGWISIGFRGVSQQIGGQAISVSNVAGRWINLSPYENDEFGAPRAYVQLTTAEDTHANAMDTVILALANQLAGNNPANIQIVSQARDDLGTTYHEAGTLWMGTNPQNSVTDMKTAVKSTFLHYRDDLYTTCSKIHVQTLNTKLRTGRFLKLKSV